jgi:glycosyltransferase involved in cell wall biosynthesis
VDRRYVLLTATGGRGAALNAGFAHASERYIAILDADDVAYAEWLRQAVAAVEAHPEFAVVGVSTIEFDGSAPPYRGSERREADEAKCIDVTLTLCHHNAISHSGALIRRDALVSASGYAQTRVSQFDYDLWVRLALAGHRIGRLNRTLVAKRVHRGQTFKESGHLRYVLRSIAVQSRAIAGLDPRPVNWLWMGSRLVWGLLPRRARRAARGRLRSTENTTAV